MDHLLRQILLEVFFITPAFVALAVVAIKRRALRQRSRLPFRELRRRPAGESLRLKLETLDDKLSEWVMYVAALPTVIGIAVAVTRPPSLTFLAIPFAVSVAWSIAAGWKFYRLLRERANYQLGFDGERFVGEELSRLAANGFEIYHDLPFDRFNIDHVLVGPPGVFAVETKTRRKPIAASGEKEYHVEFDGFRLHWPMGPDAYGIEQARNNARTLADWLSGAVGEPVSVTAILTLPGWMVDRKAPSKGVHILNPKEIAKICGPRRESLNENLLKRICYQLDQKCKLGVD